MVKMRALRQFSHTVYGNVGAGDVFECDDGYALQFVEHRLAAIVSPPQVAPAPTTPEVSEQTWPDVQKPRRGRRRK